MCHLVRWLCVWASEVGQRRAGLQHLPSLHNSPSTLLLLLLFCRMITVTIITITITDENEDKDVALDEDLKGRGGMTSMNKMKKRSKDRLCSVINIV